VHSLLLSFEIEVPSFSLLDAIGCNDAVLLCVGGIGLLVKLVRGSEEMIFLLFLRCQNEF
jgi:hypothetical protein